MKCAACGHEEHDSYWEEKPVYFQSGKRKGELKSVDKVLVQPKEEDKFIRIGIEKEFKFVREGKACDWYGYDKYREIEISLWACPKCFTIRMNE